MPGNGVHRIGRFDLMHIVASIHMHLYQESAELMSHSYQNKDNSGPKIMTYDIQRHNLIASSSKKGAVKTKAHILYRMVALVKCPETNPVCRIP